MEFLIKDWTDTVATPTGIEGEPKLTSVWGLDQLGAILTKAKERGTRISVYKLEPGACIIDWS